ncbi:hypothetical protein T439DRAFT_375786 [Meredithblackwellia eburnea MCA 4105]
MVTSFMLSNAISSVQGAPGSSSSTTTAATTVVSSTESTPLSSPSLNTTPALTPTPQSSTTSLPLTGVPPNPSSTSITKRKKLTFLESPRPSLRPLPDVEISQVFDEEEEEDDLQLTMDGQEEEEERGRSVTKRRAFSFSPRTLLGGGSSSRSRSPSSSDRSRSAGRPVVEEGKRGRGRTPIEHAIDIGRGVEDYPHRSESRSRAAQLRWLYEWR